MNGSVRESREDDIGDRGHLSPPAVAATRAPQHGGISESMKRQRMARRPRMATLGRSGHIVLEMAAVGPVDVRSVHSLALRACIAACDCGFQAMKGKLASCLHCF